MGFVIDRFEGEFALCESECGEDKNNSHRFM